MWAMGANAPRWQRGLDEVRRTTDGPIGVGTRHTIVPTFAGRTLELSNKYTRCEPNKLIEFKIWGTMRGQASYVVEPAGANLARLTSRIEMEVSSPFRLTAPLVAAILRRDVAAYLATLKELLENGAR